MKRFSFVLIVFSLLVALISTAAAPKAAGDVTLVGAGYVDGKGVVFTFHVEGKVSKSDMKGSVSVDGGRNYGLDCVKVDDETVKCTAPKAVAGHNVSVTWGGSIFLTFVPPIPSNTEYCYGIWDYWTTEERLNGWRNFGPYCQDEPAQERDEINYVVPANTYPGQNEPFSGWGAWFVNDPEACEVPNHGAAYYWAPWCFDQPE